MVRLGLYGRDADSSAAVAASHLRTPKEGSGTAPPWQPVGVPKAELPAYSSAPCSGSAANHLPPISPFHFTKSPLIR
jgi:hypothetical protein